MADGILLEMLRYNNWANAQFIAHCRALPEEALAANPGGGFGTIPDTLGHLIGNEALFCMGATGVPIAGIPAPGQRLSLAETEALQAMLAPLWEQFAGSEIDLAREVVRGTAVSPLSILLTQVMNHGTEHRTQVASILGGLGLEPPPVSPWTFGASEGRVRF